MIDYGKFSRHLASVEDRWELMRQVQREWGIPDVGANTVPAAEIAQAEARLGFALPLALKQWYSLSSNPFFLRPRLFWTNLEWPDGLKVWPEDAPGAEGLIVFQAEYQYCCEWAFRVGDAHQADPPVWYGSTQGECPPEGWMRQNDTLSEHLLQLMLVRLVHFGPRYFGTMTKIEPSLAARLERHFPELGFPNWLEYGPGCRLRGGEDVLILTDARPPFAWNTPALCLGASSYEGLERATDLLEVDWDCVEEISADQEADDQAESEGG